MRQESSLHLSASSLVISLLVLAAIGLANTASIAADYLPSPYDILRSRHLETPLLDAVTYCVPGGLDAVLDPVLEQATAGEWREARSMLSDWASGLDRATPELVVLDAVLQTRASEDRAGWLEAEQRLRELLRRDGIEPVEFCIRMELARILLHMSREPEASAQLTRAEQWLERRDERGPRLAAVSFWRAEVLYRVGDAFDAHLVYRKLSKVEDARLALAARLRLTDLSFDSGKIDSVSDEYEALLPRASAFGASTTGWALRASEAALDAGEAGRALRWLERFLELGPPRDARDAAEIRLADLDVSYNDPLRARKRLSGVTGRRRSEPIGSLAAVRAIDLGVSPGSPDQRFDILMLALRDQRNGVRRYALGVLMNERAERGDLDGALAVATRLAYEGIDSIVNPEYEKRLDGLLSSVTTGGDCRQVVRALGGRYGILIERASKPAAFARVGECFEEMELPWLAATVYRSIARRFGTIGAQGIALPLARSSLAIGEVTLARRVASAALEDPSDQEVSWRAVLAEADFADGRAPEAAAGLRRVLASAEAETGALARDRGKWIRLLALTLDAKGNGDGASFIAERVPGWLADSNPPPGARAAMLEAAMLAGHQYRREGRDQDAAVLYSAVEREADAGALRSSARFWLGLAESDRQSASSSWGEDPNLEIGAPWARYAVFERHFDPLWKSYGQERK